MMMMNGGGMGGGMKMMMDPGAHGGGGHMMTFHHSTSAVLLFDFLQIGPDPLSYFLGLVFVVVVGVARQELLRISEQEHLGPEKRALLYFCQATLSYLLMLVAMTFNVGLFLAVILGLSIGYYRSLVHHQQAAKVSGKSECCA